MPLARELKTKQHYKSPEDFLVVQGLVLCDLNAGGLDSIPGQGTRSCMPQLRVCMLQLKILHASIKAWHRQIS